MPVDAETYQKPTVEPYSFAYKATESRKHLVPIAELKAYVEK